MPKPSDIKLFQVHSVSELRGYRDVSINWFVDKRPRPLFGIDGSLGVEARDLIADYESPDGYDYTAAYLDECFTEDEARALSDWVKKHRNTESTILPVELPVPNNVMPLGCVPVGGGQDILMIAESPDYDLPFAVLGYYDLRDCERIEQAWQPS